MRMVWGVYFRKGKVFVPTVARAEAGYYLNVEPVAVVNAGDLNCILSAVRAAIDRGNPTIPTPTRANFPKPVLPKLAGVRSWPQFARESLYWKLRKASDGFQILPGRLEPDGGWVDDEAKAEALPSGTTAEGVAKRMAQIIQAVSEDTSEPKA